MSDQQPGIVKITSPSSGSSGSGSPGPEAQGVPSEGERRFTLYVNLVLLCILAFYVLTDERDVFSLFIKKNGLFVRDELLDENVLDLREAYHLLPQSSGGVGANGTSSSSLNQMMQMPGRFPRLGTRDFRKQCSWTAMPSNAYNNCTVFMTPRPDGHEVSCSTGSSGFWGCFEVSRTTCMSMSVFFLLRYRSI